MLCTRASFRKIVVGVTTLVRCTWSENISWTVSQLWSGHDDRALTDGRRLKYLRVLYPATSHGAANYKNVKGIWLSNVASDELRAKCKADVGETFIRPLHNRTPAAEFAN